MRFKIHRKTIQQKRQQFAIKCLALVFCAFAAFSVVVSIASYATTSNVQVLTTGWLSVGRSEVIIPDITQLSIANALANGSIVTTGDYKIETVTASDWNAIDTFEVGQKIIVAEPASNFPRDVDTSVSGSVVFTWPGIARYNDNGVKKTADVIMTVDNQTVLARRANNTGVIILGDYEDTLAYYHNRRTKNEVGIGTAYDVDIKIVDNVTKQPLNRTVAFSMTDLDTCDGIYHHTHYPDTNPTCNWDSDKYFGDQEDELVKGPYAEGIKLIDGVSDNKVYLEDNTSLIHYVENDGNMRFVGTLNIDDSANVVLGRRAGLIMQMNAGEFKFRLSGATTRARNGFVPPSKVVTEKLGSYTNAYTLTETDNEVLWRDNKTIEIDLPRSSGYRIKRTIIDGTETAGPAMLTATANGYSYTFSEVTYDHVFQVEIERTEFEFCKVDSEHKFTYGAVFSVTGTDSSGQPMRFNQDGSTLFPHTTISWTSTGCDSIYTSSSDGTFILQEVSPPNSSYIPIQPVTFTIRDGHISHQAGEWPSNRYIRQQGSAANIIDVYNLAYSAHYVQICKRVGNTEGPDSSLFGAQFEITSTSGSRFSSIDDNVITGDKHDFVSVTNTKITWDLYDIDNSHACLMLKDIPDGDYVINETMTPPYYSTAQPVSFTVLDGEAVGVAKRDCGRYTYDSSLRYYVSNKVCSSVENTHDFEEQYNMISTINIDNFLSLKNKICKTNDSGAPLANAVLRLSIGDGYGELDENSIITDSDGAAVRSYSSSQISWRTGSTGCVTVGMIPDGPYILEETAVPTGYNPAYNPISITIRNGMIANVYPSNVYKEEGGYYYITLENSVIKKQLTINKTVKGAGGDMNKEFAVTMSLSVPNNTLTTLDYTKTLANGTTSSGRLNVSNNQTTSFALKGSESIAFNLPYGTTFSIQEPDYSSDGYTTTYLNNVQSGTIQNSDIQIGIINTKDGTIVTGIAFDYLKVAIIGSCAILTSFSAICVYRTRKKL